MATIKLLLGIICFACISSFGMLKRDLLVNPEIKKEAGLLKSRFQLVNIARGEIGVREKTGRNDGLRVETYLSVVGLKKGQPYCAGFISWVYKQAGFLVPKSGWSPALFPSSRLAWSALQGNLIAVYFPKLKRIAHVGLIERLDGDWCVSIEGNTNLQGSNEGDGVYRKRRHLKTIYRIADWVK
ncbi:peptidoglycan-binding protein [Pedobacter sp. PAMC26386]|nr:peptidoglycan-binding protein [Pedobacter sp. PAMC26386]